MSATTICAHLATLLRVLYPLTQAYADPPNSISPGAGAGAWVPLPGPGTEDEAALGALAAYNGAGVGAYLDVRIYHLLYFSGPLGAGGPGDMARRCKPVLDSWKGFFKARAMLSDPASGLAPALGVLRCRTLEDTGVTGIEWGGVTYVGVTCDLEVQEVVTFNFVAGE